MKVCTILALLLAVAAAAQQTPAAGAKSAFDKTTLAAYVRHMVPYPEQVNIEVSDPRPSDLPNYKEVTIHASLGQQSEDRVFYVSSDGQKIFQAKVYDIAKNPFQDNLDKLKTELEPSMGTPGAPVVLVVFSDFQCPYCKQEAESLRAELLKAYPTQVRLYFKNFPLTQIHPWALPAAVLGRCVFRQKPAAFWTFHDWIYAHQGEITEANLREKVNEFMKTNNLDADQINACAADGSALAEVRKSMDEAHDLGVNSTPTLFVNGRMISSAIPWANLKQFIDMEIGYQTTNKDAGEACCTVAIPNPLTGGK